MTRVDGNSPEQYDLNRLHWEALVELAQNKMFRAHKLNQAVASADYIKSFYIRSPESELVPAQHVQFQLAPQSHELIVDDVAAVTVRIPILPNEGTEDIPTTGVFLELFRHNSEAMHMLLTPNGPRAYHDTSDIFEVETGETSDDFEAIFEFAPKEKYDVAASLGTSIAQNEAMLNWPNAVALEQILKNYEVSPQETSGEVLRVS